MTGNSHPFILPFSMRTFFRTCTLVFFVSTFVSAQDLEQLRKTIDANVPAIVLPDDLGRKPPPQALIDACKAVVDAASQIYALPNLDEHERHRILQREAAALIPLAYVDTPAYYPRLTLLSDELDRIGKKELAKLTEEHVLKIGSVLATQTGNHAMNISAKALAERMVFYAEQHPGRDSLQMIEQFLQRIRLMNANQRDRRLGAVAPIFQEYFQKIYHMDKAFALEADIMRTTLPGNPMLLMGVDLDGRDFDPASLKDKVVLLQFWGTWCGPCRAEIPELIALYEKYRDSGFEIIGINTGIQGDDERKVKQFVETTLFGGKKIPWTILHEGLGERKNKNTITKFYGIDELPVLILIGRDGKVLHLHPLLSALDSLIAEATSPLAALEFTEEEKKILEENERKRQEAIDQQIKEALSLP